MLWFSESAITASRRNQVGCPGEVEAGVHLAVWHQMFLTLRGDQKPASTDSAIQPGPPLPPFDPRLYPWQLCCPSNAPPPQPLMKLNQAMQTGRAIRTKQNRHCRTSIVQGEKNIDFLKERSLRLFSQTASTERSRDLSTVSSATTCIRTTIITFDSFGGRILGDVHLLKAWPKRPP